LKQIHPTVQAILTDPEILDSQGSQEHLAALIVPSAAQDTAPATLTPTDTTLITATALPGHTAHSVIQTAASHLVSTSDFAPTPDLSITRVTAIEEAITAALVGSSVEALMALIPIQSAP
jgi:hypothetical protein